MDRQDELKSLYQDVIVDHVRYPRFKGRTADCQYCAEGKNPLCGDTVVVFCETKIPDAHSADPKLYAHFEGSGCSISQASASMMCEAIQGVSFEQAKAILNQAEGIYTGKQKTSLGAPSSGLQEDEDELDSDLDALAGVSQFPVRIKCAALPWKTFEILLTDYFSADGTPKPGCHQLKKCDQSQTRKLKVVTTE